MGSMATGLSTRGSSTRMHCQGWPKEALRNWYKSRCGFVEEWIARRFQEAGYCVTWARYEDVIDLLQNKCSTLKN